MFIKFAIQALDETTSDLDICNNRCLQLGSELKLRNNEVEKLRIFKFMARQADIREDTLRAKVEMQWRAIGSCCACINITTARRCKAGAGDIEKSGTHIGIQAQEIKDKV